jgi:hypothetical protein
MDSEAKVSGLAKKKKNFPGSFQLLESMTPRWSGESSSSSTLGPTRYSLIS